MVVCTDKKVSIYFDATPTENLLCCVDTRNNNPWFKSMGGKLTNNDLEWYALLSAIKYASKVYRRSLVKIYGDSKLVVKQFNDEFKVNKEEFMILKDQAKEYVELNNVMDNDVFVYWVPRDENLAGIKLDKHVRKLKK